EADLLSLLPVSPVISEVEEDAQRIRQFPGVSMEAPCSSLMSGGHKAGTLGLEPGQSLGVPGEVPLDRRFAPIPVPAAMLSDKPGRRIGVVQVPVEQSTNSCLLVGVGSFGVNPLSGIQTEEIMEAVASRGGGRFDEMRIDQRF